MSLPGLLLKTWPLVIGISLVSVPIFLFLMWKRALKAAIAFLLFLVLERIYVSFYTVYAFGGAFGPGIVLFCFSALSVPLFALLMVIAWRSFYKRFRDDKPRLWIYLIGAVLIVCLQLAPFTGYFIIRSTCYSLNRQTAAPIISAVQTYQRQTGSYPAELEDLVPEYLADLASPTCSWLSSDEYKSEIGFEILSCSDDTLLTLYSVDGSSIQRYNFRTGVWSSISFLDGACSFLR